MRSLAIVGSLVLAALCTLPAAAQIPITTIVNPSFETGTPGSAVSSGWAASVGNMFIATAGSSGLLGADPAAAYHNSNFLTGNRQVGGFAAGDYPNGNAQSMGVFQDVDLSPYAGEISLGGRGLELSFAYNDADTGDNGTVAFSFLDGGNSPIGSSYMFETDSAPTSNGSWLTSTLIGEVPVGAATVRFSLQSDRISGTGSIRNSSFDDFRANLLDSVPVPPLPDRVHGNLIQFDGDGNWTWYSDERAIVDPNSGHVLVNSVGFSPSYVNNGQNIGIVDVVDFDPETGRRVRTQLSNLSGITSQNIQRDDHNVGALLVLPDGRYLALYANHGNQGGLGDRWTRWRVSNSPGDSTSWSNEQIFDWFSAPGTDTNVSYHNLFYLSEEDEVYNLSRGNNQAPNILLYDMNTNDLSYGGQLADSTAGGYSTGYFKYASNGVDRIYFTHTETHPRNFNTSIYAGYIEGGQSFDMLGNLIDNNIFDNEVTGGGEQAIPDVTEFTLVHQADPLGNGYNRLWTVDTNLDADRDPMALYISRWNPDGATSDGSTNNPIDHRLHFAHWNDQTQQWETQEIAKMGRRLYGSEQDYTGLGALVPGDENTLYISTTFDPRDASGQTETPRHEIYKGEFDGGDWNWTAITENSSVDNLRPIIPDAHGGDQTIIWFRGNYSSAQSIDAAVVGIVERDDEQLGLVNYIDADSTNTMYANGGALQTSTPSGSTGPIDNLWHERTGFGNAGSVLTSSESGFEDAPMLKTTIDGLDDGLYDVFAYFWSDDDEDWRLQASLESDNLIDFRMFGSQHADEDQFVAIETTTANSNDLLLYRAYLGRSEVVGGSDIEVFVDDWQSFVGGAIRTWYDGVGYALVSDVVEGLPADYNDDGVVNAADYTVWRDNLGTSTILPNDPSPGMVTQEDYETWVANFGNTLGGGSVSNLTVPEPATFVTLLVGTLAILFRRGANVS